MNSDLNLQGAWSNLWGQITSWAPGLGTVLAVLGVLVITVSVIMWAWKKRRGGGGGASGFPVMAVIVGLVLTGPSVLIPIILTILQVLIAIVVNGVDWLVGIIA